MKGKRFTAMLLAAAAVFGAVQIPADATALPHKADYQEPETNFAKLLQYSLYFYDANMCGTGVTKESLLPWRGDCHIYDAKVPLQPYDAKTGGTNLSAAFMKQYADILDPDGDGTVDVSGGYHDAGDHVKFGLPEAYAASVVSWGYYEFRDAYETIGESNSMLMVATSGTAVVI